MDSTRAVAQTPGGWKIVTAFGFRISCFFVLAAAQAGSLETFDGVITTGAVTLENGQFVVTPTSGGSVKVDPAEVLRAQFSSTPASDDFAPGVVLRNGSRLTGPFSALTDPVVRLERSKISVPGGEIAWVVYDPFSAKIGASAPVGKVGALLPGGDFFEGAVKAADDKSAKLQNPIFGTRTLRGHHQEVLALLLRDLRPSAALFEVWTRDGSLYRVDALTLEKTGVMLKNPPFDGVKVETKDLAEIRAGSGRFQPLTAFKPMRVDPIAGCQIAQCFAMENTLMGHPFESVGAARGHGFEANVGVTATWNVPAGFSALTVQTVVSEFVPATNRLVFAIYANGRPFIRSALLTSADKPALLRVPLAGVQTISFRVEAGVPVNATGTGLWLEPTLLRQ